MEKNYWQIDENLYKVHITSDVYENLKDDFKIEDTAKYIKEGKINAYDYFDDGSILDIEWIINNDKTYKAARVLVAFGGPNIWINTQTNTVDGYWYTDNYKAPFIDNMGLDDYLEELYSC